MLQSERIYVILLLVNIVALLFVYWLVGIVLESKVKYDINYEVTCESDFLDCKNFSSFDAANIGYAYCYALTGRDVHHLDEDGDRIACEFMR